MGSSTRKLRRAQGLTGYEYQRDLKRAQAARKRADRALGLGDITVTAGPDSPPIIQPLPRVYEPESVSLTIAGQTLESAPLFAPREPSAPLVIIDDPIRERRRVSPIQLIALISMLGVGLSGRGRDRG